MARYLMTHSLLSSWLYALKENPFEDATTERDSFEEFLKVLRREPTETTEAMRKGIMFEDLVTDIIEKRADTTHQWFDAANKIAQQIKGGRLQYKAYKEIEVNGMTLLLYGRLDALKAGVVYDIKFSSGYDVGKYFSGTQHPTYLELVPEAVEFTYLVSNGSAVWPETYRREETQSIVPIISDFFEWLNAQGLMEIYKEKWVSK